MIVIRNVLIPTFRMDVNVMSAKTDSSWATVMNLIFAMAATLKSMVWKRQWRTILTVQKVNQRLEQEIISKLCKYIDGTITLKQFWDWFVPTTWNIDSKDFALNKLVCSIKLRFAEYGNGHWAKEELRERLIDLIL